MKYTIVWKQNKTEGIILSGEDAPADADHACCIYNYRFQGVSSLAENFRDTHGKYQDCTIQNGLVPLQPTKEMIKAGIDEYNTCSSAGDETEDMIVFIWKAMANELNK